MVAIKVSHYRVKDTTSSLCLERGKYMFRVACVLLTFITFVLLGFGVNGCTPSPEPGRYYHKELGFSIKFPDGWDILLEDDGTTIIASCPIKKDDRFYVDVSVGMNILPFGADLDYFFHEAKRWMNVDSATIEEEESGELTIDGKEAKWVLVNYHVPGGYGRTLGYCLKKRRRGYVISCAAEYSEFSEYRSLFEEVAQSFRFE